MQFVVDVRMTDAGRLLSICRLTETILWRTSRQGAF